MKFVALIVCLFFLTNAVVAQKKMQKIKPIVAAEISLLNGDNHVNGQLNLQAGVQQQNWQLSAGAGFDYYKYRTVPVYIELKRVFGLQQHQFFLYFKGGADLAWPTEDQKTLRNPNWWGGNSPSVFKNGVYIDGGFGYTLFNKKHHGFYTAAGFSQKSLTEIYTEQVWNGTISVPAKRTAVYQMNRLGLRVGYQF